MVACCMYSTCNSHASGPGQTLEKAGKLRCWQQVRDGSLSSTRVKLLKLIQTLRYALLFYISVSLFLCVTINHLTPPLGHVSCLVLEDSCFNI